MKPQTKFQKLAVSLSRQLPSITQVQRTWGYERCFKHQVRSTTAGLCCLECGHKWASTAYASKKIICPHCGKRLEVLKSTKRVFRQEAYFCIITTFHNLQVIRYFLLRCEQRIGSAAVYCDYEIAQHWIAPNGNHCIIGLSLNMSYYYSGSWNFSSGLELRRTKPAYNINCQYTYSRIRIIPKLKRNGFDGNCHKYYPAYLFKLLLTDSQAETLFKAGQFDLLDLFSRPDLIEHLWGAIRICLRNNYRVQDASMWADYIRLLEIFGKDTRNAKYVCPSNLQQAHDMLVAKQQRRQELERRAADRLKEAERLAEIEEFEKQYVADKSKFFNLRFMDDLLEIHVLSSVHEFYEEGKTMHHCVFTNEYFRDKDALILSATMQGVRVETVELSLSTYEVRQSRGVCNRPTTYHDRIIKLVEQNIPLIRSCESA